MSLYGTLRTSVSGMNAQSNKLGTISDNIANSNTTGYKKATTDFSSLIVDSSTSEYNSGSVNTKISYDISKQGTTTSSTSATDMMVNGDGFFVVQDGGGSTYLTRAGSFTVDATTGNLVNTAGYTLMGYDISKGNNVTPVVNSTAGMVPVNIGSIALAAVPTTSGTMTANLQSTSAVVSGATPGGNTAAATYTYKSSVSVYDNLGNQVVLDVYFTKTAAANPAATPPTTGGWEMAIYNQADATTGGTTPFPYSSSALATQTLTFDSTGQLLTPATGKVSLTVPNGQTMNFDISTMTQLSNDYSIKAPTNGSPATSASDIKVNSQGIVYAVDGNGNTTNLYRIPVATVKSPDNLTPVSGNAYQVTQESGAMQIGLSGSAGVGTIKSNTLENSNVDVASELTDMIVAQRDYTANSKVFQTGTDLLDVLMNLKR
ncbi:flagellar basal body FlaE protein [Azorhizobium caulinodans ORS 571]|uniref:Flagellar hook protein FlgE n=1 Tax=Azorhizobium caulinodans (strain ATCC 43989 / DSM 5975 / JCM 20966 / LMG 6465 / NBRC 14845 / NCIMB 13405 / ORS 571) TaxID=438753 RepID=A8IPL6_AZOC5|nr:flagellar hook protein FlgE [Azorhizobium caulinodans]BAF86645.1 flagellar basal body FlaE protein [Azorhizobium caulinodans ORS 571]